MRRIALAGLIALAAAPRPAAAQLHYPEGTLFLNGLNETRRWSNRDIAPLLNQRVDLGGYVYTQLSTWRPVSVQSRELRDWHLASRAGQGVLVGHSMGGVVARDAFLNPDPAHNSGGQIAGLVTVASPHRGAPIAQKAREYDGINGGQLIDGFFHTLVTLKLNPVAGVLDFIASALIHAFVENAIVNGAKAVVVDLFGNKFGLNEAAEDLKPSSPTIARLSSTTDSRPHASVFGTIPQKDAVWVLASAQNYGDGRSLIRNKNIARGALKGCQIIFYNIIVKTGVGRACHVGDRAIGSVEERWSEWTGTKHERGDGLLPRSTMLYPGEARGSSRNIEVSGENHFSIVYRPSGLDGVAQGMRTVGMRSR